MKIIKVDINNDDYEFLKEIADGQNTNVAKLVGAFIQDLTYSERSGGSDERALAREWLSRNTYRDW